MGRARTLLAAVWLVAAGWAGAALGAPPQSDDFDQFNLDSQVWTVVDPVGDGVIRMIGADSGDARLELEVPAGVSHDPWKTNRALRVMQAVDNADFEIEAVFQSEPAARYQMQGLMIEQDSNDWVRFDFYHDGSRLRVFGARTVNGASSAFFNKVINAGDGRGLRVARSGNQWTVSYLRAGTTWTVVAPALSHTMVVNGVGLFGANHQIPATLSPAFTAAIDYFQNNAAPIVDEDGGAGPDETAPVVFDVQTEALDADTLEVRWQTDERATGEVAYGLTPSYELGVEIGGADQFEHLVLLSGLTPGESYHLGITARDSAGNATTLPDMVVEFDVPPPPQAPVVDVWYGLNQHFGLVGQPQPWVNIVGKVSDADGVVIDLSYRLNGSATSIPLSIGPGDRRLVAPGDFNVDLATASLSAGANFVDITAIDDTGSATTVTVQVNYTPDTVWPLPYTVDWSALGSNQEVATETWVVDGKWTLTEIAGQQMVRTAEPGYDRLLAVGDRTWVDYEFEVPIVYHSLSSLGGGGVLMRWNGHTDDPVAGRQPKEGWRPSGAVIWGRSGIMQILSTDGPGNDTGLALKSKNIVLGVPYIMKGRVETDGAGARYSVKMWEQGAPEPSGWELVGQDPDARTPGGSLLLLAHLDDVSFGSLTIRELTPPVDTAPPVISGVGATVTTNSALITWTTDEASDSLVEYGLTSAYGASASSAALTQSHGVQLNDLSAGTTYHYRVTSTDPSGNAAVSDDMQFTTATPGEVAAIQSDEFDGAALDTGIWTFNNALAPDGSLAMTGTQAALSVPGGSDHEVWTAGIRVPRIVQEVADGDFHVEVKFDSLVRDRYQEQGIVIEQDPGAYLRFEFYGDGSRTLVLAASIRNGVASIKHNAPVSLSPPYYMRLRRSGTSWVQSYSDDGVAWTDAGIIANDPLVMSSIGLYAGNALRPTSPAHTALFDYFRNVPEPVRALCLGDLNADGAVSGADLAVLLAAFGTPGQGADLDGSGVVDSSDLGLLLGMWGDCN